MDSNRTFLHSHWDSDPLQLLLQQGRYPGVDMRWVAQQIEGRRQAREKWPSFFENEQFEYPPKLNREQSSSEAAARYKAGLVPEGCRLVDMTGGMGVDSYFFSLRASHVDYWERDPELAALVERNMQTLGAENVAVHSGDSAGSLGFQPEQGWRASCPPADGTSALRGQAGRLTSVYLDPARRDGQGRKVSGFEASEPNVLELLPQLREVADCILIKASPMIDIALAARSLGFQPEQGWRASCPPADGTSAPRGQAGRLSSLEVHVVAVRGECKEVLFLVGSFGNFGGVGSFGGDIHAVDLWPDRTHHHRFTLAEEAEAEVLIHHSSPITHHYLLEPNAALLKAGCYNLLTRWYPVEKLARNTHLYASPTLLPDWPGRQFEVLQELPLNAKDVARAIPSKKAHILSRNHPLSAEELRKKLRLKEGGDLHIVATTLGSKPVGLLCRRLQ